jgi:hypothetical protein
MMFYLPVSLHLSLISLASKAILSISWEAVTTGNKKDLERYALNLCKNKTAEDLNESSEMEERLPVLLTEKEAMQLGMEELQKKLEISKLLLFQSSSQMQQKLVQMNTLKEKKECSARVLQPGQLQENLGKLKEMVMLKRQAAPGLQEQ